VDVPNASIMVIEDAEGFGLSQLHQLRGRVGRYKHRAYCYLLIDQRKHVTPEAARRLRAIEEFSELGAGFAIAMRDLEFRGAGNVLGSQQSGHIAAIGYELYCELLEAEVRRARKLPPKISIDVNVDLPGDAFIPEDFIVDQRMRIDFYRRINRIASEDDSATLLDEIQDRFGAPPPAVLRMLSLAELRIDAAIWQVAMIRLDEQDGWPYLAFDYTDRARLKQLAKIHGGSLRIVDEHTAYWELPTREVQADAVLALAKSVLRPT
ncbi:MAG: TRCF domain-containing protein, partial [Planctomycetota bacterium]